MKQQRNDRMVRIAGLIQEALAPILQRNQNEKPHPLVTITSVNVSKDLAYANIYVSILSDDEPLIAEVINALNKDAKSMRFILAKQIRLRIVPALRFIFDESALIGFRISRLIDEANKDATAG
jgi:ribosome-binding factor A